MAQTKVPAYCRTLGNKPSWTHIRCSGCVDMPTELEQLHALAAESEQPLSAQPPHENVSLPLIQSRPLLDEELLSVCGLISEALTLREKYRSDVDREVFDDPSVVDEVSEEPHDPFTPPATFVGRCYSFQLRHGTMVVWPENTPERSGAKAYGARDEVRPPAFTPAPSLAAYTEDLARLLHICSDAAVNSFCYGRLQQLEAVSARLQPAACSPPSIVHRYAQKEPRFADAAASHPPARSASNYTEWITRSTRLPSRGMCRIVTFTMCERWTRTCT